MSRADAYGAAARCDGYSYDPETLTIVTDKSHPLYDERVKLPVDEALVLSIMAHGVLEPIIIRKNGEDAKGNPIMEVIDGRQRVRACIEANRRLKEAGQEPKRIPAIVRRATGEDAMGWMITANEVRYEDPPITKARKLQRYLDGGHDEKEARVTFGLDSRGIRNLLQLNSCSARVQKLLEQDRISTTVARDLSTLPEAEQDKKIDEFEAAGLLSSRSPKASEEAKKAKGNRGRTRKPSQYGRLRPAKQVAPQMKKLAAREETLSPTGKGFLAAMRWMFGDDEALAIFEHEG